jgi:hypothetical protein
MFNDNATTIEDNFTNHMQQLNFESKFGHLEEVLIDRSNLNIQVLDMIVELKETFRMVLGELNYKQT